MKLNEPRDYENMEASGYFNIDYTNSDMPNMNYNNSYPNSCGETMPGVVCPPIYECPKETVCHRYICHEVPHIMPCNTRIINHHIYRHTYTPTYSCCEQNEVENVYERRCC